MLTAIADAVRSGVPTVAECAGLLYLCQSVDHAAMIGVLPATAKMTPRLTLSYRTASTDADPLLTRRGESVTGHEFHRTPPPPAPGAGRSEERREGKECVSPCRSQRTPFT